GACAAWRSLDAFLAPADERRYEPDRFVAAVTALRQHGKNGDAATLLANHRHPQHCNPQLVEHARALGRRPELGIHLRADVLSVALVCGNPEQLDGDAALL